MVERYPPITLPATALRLTAGIVAGLVVLQIAVRFAAIVVDMSIDLALIHAEAGLIDEDTSATILGRMRWFGHLREFRRGLGPMLALAWWAWLITGNRFARALGLAPTDGPWGIVGWWFVPIANFLLPLRPLIELWQVSERPEPITWREVPVPWLLRGWWLLLWLGVLLRAIVFARILEHADLLSGQIDSLNELLHQLRELVRADAAQQCVALLTAAAALVIVHRITIGLRAGAAAHELPQ